MGSKQQSTCKIQLCRKMAFFTLSNEFASESYVNSNQIFCSSVLHGCKFGWCGNLLEGRKYPTYYTLFTTHIQIRFCFDHFLVRCMKVHLLTVIWNFLLYVTKLLPILVVIKFLVDISNLLEFLLICWSFTTFCGALEITSNIFTSSNIFQEVVHINIAIVHTVVFKIFYRIRET